MKSKQSQEQHRFKAFITPNKAISMWEQSPERREEGMREAYTDSDCAFKMEWEAGRQFFKNQEKPVRHEILRELDKFLPNNNKNH